MDGSSRNTVYFLWRTSKKVARKECFSPFFCIVCCERLTTSKSREIGLLVLFVTFATIVMISINIPLTVLLAILCAVGFKLKRLCYYMLYLSKAGHTYEVLL